MRSRRARPVPWPRRAAALAARAWEPEPRTCHGRSVIAPIFRRGCRCESVGRGLALAAEAAPVDAELAHARAQRVRVDGEQPRGAERAFDAPESPGERGFDVLHHRVVEAPGRAGRG